MFVSLLLLCGDGLVGRSDDDDDDDYFIFLSVSGNEFRDAGLFHEPPSSGSGWIGSFPVPVSDSASREKVTKNAFDVWENYRHVLPTPLQMRPYSGFI